MKTSKTIAAIHFNQRDASNVIVMWMSIKNHVVFNYTLSVTDDCPNKRTLFKL